MVNKKFIQSEYWSNKWSQHIDNYLSAPPRCGIWLNYLFPAKNLSFLESAGGSCRDSRYLFNEGRQSVGTDFDQKTLDYVNSKYPNSSFTLRREDGFKFNYPDNSFDVVFNNGFWVLFRDDRDIFRLIQEQARVAGKYLIALVHNKDNPRLVASFKKKSIDDDLYNIRFFDVQDLKCLLKSSGLNFRSIRFDKFGGRVDDLFAIERKVPALAKVVRWLVPRLYRFQNWADVERIALIIELDKSKK